MIRRFDLYLATAILCAMVILCTIPHKPETLIIREEIILDSHSGTGHSIALDWVADGVPGYQTFRADDEDGYMALMEHFARIGKVYKPTESED